MRVAKEGISAAFVAVFLSLSWIHQEAWSVEVPASAKAQAGPISKASDGRAREGSGAEGVSGSAPSASEPVQVDVQRHHRQRTDIDRALIVGGVQAGPVASLRKEFSTQGSELMDSRRGLIFSRCAYGQKWTEKGCAGRASDLTRLDIFNPQTKAVLGVWRVPSVDELGAVMAYFSGQAESPFKHGVKYWTSTRAAKGMGYQLMHYGPKRGIGLTKAGTLLANSEDEGHATLILVRKGIR